MRIHFQIKCWRVVGVVSAVATITVIAEPLHVPAPPLPPGAEVRAQVNLAPPPLPPSPVENFRFWLNLSSAERTPLLSRMPNAQRKALEAKLASYDALSPDAQDLRLRETQ